MSFLKVGIKSLTNMYQEGPPNLDEIFRKMFTNNIKAKQAFKKPGANSSSDFSINFKLIFLLLTVVWAISGIIIVKPAQKATVLRFGKYYETLERGMHWVPAIISSVYVIDVNKIHSFKHSAEMLTKDENIVDVSVAVWFRIQNPRDYLFNVANPALSLKEATASALRQVVGHTELDQILTKGRNRVMEETKSQLLEILKRYRTGIEITELNLLPAKPPEAVTAAFDDAIKAREDEQRYINQARAYAEKVEPIAIGQATRIVKQAQADAQQLVLQSKAEVAPFLALLPAHKAEPGLTNTRLYFSTMAAILQHVQKIITNNKANLILAPQGNRLSAQSVAASLPALADTGGVDMKSAGQSSGAASLTPFPSPPRQKSAADPIHFSSQGRSNYSFMSSTKSTSLTRGE